MKSNKIILIVTSIFLTIIVVSIFYAIRKDQSNYLGFKSGKYYILYKDNNKLATWDVSISNNDIKREIIENKSNEETLEKFKNTIMDMKNNRMDLFLTTIYLIYVLIIFLVANKDEHIRKSRDKSFQLVFILLIIFLTYKIVNYFIKYNSLCKDAVVYYFNIIK